METSATQRGQRLVFRDIHAEGNCLEEELEKIRAIFKQEIEPLYGNQKAPLLSIAQGLDRRCLLLCNEESEIHGLLVYQKALSNEYHQQGILDSLEVKTVIVLKPEERVAARLIRKMKKIASKLHAHSIHLIASNRSNFSVESLKRFGFQNVATRPSTYQKDEKEHLLKLPIALPKKKGEEWQPVSKTTPKVRRQQKPTQKLPSLDRLMTIKNVHQDDIHGLVRLANNTFVSGSKDGSLKQWKLDGSFVKAIHSPGRIDYRNWITALTPLDEQRWISATRNGHAHLWDSSGEWQHNLHPQHAPFPKGGFNRKERNTHRINCLTSFAHYIPDTFFVGWASQFTLHSVTDLSRISCTYTSQRDWVYAIQPVSAKSLLAVTGCRLEIYQDEEGIYKWSLHSTLIPDDENTYPRPFISAIVPLKQNVSFYGAAVFDGSVRVVDIHSQEVIFYKKEHKNRVWTIENISETCFASCADDGFIKLWDMRMHRSVRTVKDNLEAKARVSVLMKIDDNQLVSGSCPDDIQRARDKAQFSIWDIRRV